MSDINGFKNPEEANFKFQMMVGVTGVVQQALNVSSAGVTGDDDGGLFRQRIEQLLNGSGEENSGSGS